MYDGVSLCENDDGIEGRCYYINQLLFELKAERVEVARRFDMFEFI